MSTSNFDIESLNNIIDSGDPREIKRALAVRMAFKDFYEKDIAEVLRVSLAFIRKWKSIFLKEGAESLYLGYRGSKGYLTEEEKEEIISYIDGKKTITVDEIKKYIKEEFDVLYESNQSYYDLLHEARMSWKKSEAFNPKGDEKEILRKREEIQGVLEKRKEEIRTGELGVWIEDECHLMWGDSCGYVWGKKNEKTQVIIKNKREKQTYYGAINYYTKRFITREYDKANSENTVKFVEYLRLLSRFEKIIIIWDGASFHKYKEMKKYLEKINFGLEKKDWNVTCFVLAPNAPEQNPVEDIWLKGKNFIRKNFILNKTFNKVKQSFENFLNRKVFNFEKLSSFGDI